MDVSLKKVEITSNSDLIMQTVQILKNLVISYKDYHYVAFPFLEDCVGTSDRSPIKLTSIF